MHISTVIRDPAPKGNFCNADILGKKLPALTPYQEAEIAGQRSAPFEGVKEKWENHRDAGSVGDQEETRFVWAPAVNGRVTLYNGNGPGLEEGRRALGRLLP